MYLYLICKTLSKCSYSIADILVNIINTVFFFFAILLYLVLLLREKDSLDGLLPSNTSNLMIAGKR